MRRRQPKRGTGVAVSETLVLCYHAVSERWPAELSVTPDRLEEQLTGLVAQGYRGLTFYDAVFSPLPGPKLAVTFDDAFKSVFDLAAPVLARAGVPGTVFVPTAHAGARRMVWPGIDQWVGTEHEDELEAMSWADLRELADRGWEIGSHTRTHPHLTTVDDRTLADELEGSRERCAE